MCDDFIKTINDDHFIYGFIYECAKLINNLHEHDNYNLFSYKILRRICYANNHYYKKRTYRRI